MALGNPTGRPRTRESNAIERRVRKHYELMTEYIKQGLSRDTASKKAYDDVIKLKIK